MTKVIASVAVGLLLLLGLAGGFLHPGGGQAVAGGPSEKTVALAVKNMYCADCPFIVKKVSKPCPASLRRPCLIKIKRPS